MKSSREVKITSPVLSVAPAAIVNVVLALSSYSPALLLSGVTSTVMVTSSSRGMESAARIGLLSPSGTLSITGASSTRVVSVTVTGRSADTESYPPPDAVWVRVALSCIASSSAVAETVTVCRVFQFWSVKVRLDLSRARSVPVMPPMMTVTSPAGTASNSTS